MQITCTLCGEGFKRTPAELKRSKRHFCSRSCAVTYNNRASPKRSVEGSCQVCQTPIRSSLRYCSSICRDLARQRRKLSPEEQRVRWKDRVVVWRRRTKLRAIAYKGGACIGCSYAACPAALEFHHTDPQQKDFQISGKNIRSWDRMRVELDKCLLVCAVCHREIHAGWRTPEGAKI